MNRPFDLFGRDRDRSRLLGALGERSVLLMGPRRVGKTRLLSQLSAERGGPWRFVHVDLQGQKTVAELVQRLKHSLEQAELVGLARSISERVESVEVAGVKVQVSEQAKLWDGVEALLRAAVANLPQNTDLVLALDEVPWWLDEVEKGESGSGRVALARLRALRQPGAFERRVRMVLTGSTGLVDLAGEFGASAEINDLLPVLELCPLEAEFGRALFEAECANHGATRVESEACERAQELTAGFPWWLKLLAGKAAAFGGDAVDVAAVERGADDLLGFRNRVMFEDEGREHFERRYGPEATKAAWAVLDLAAADAEGSGHEALVAAALGAGAKSRGQAQEYIYRLADSWYLQERDGGWRFLLPLFRLWWLKYGGER